MKHHTGQTKKMVLGVAPDLMKTIAAVKEVAQEENVPDLVYPNSQPPPPAPATEAAPSTPPVSTQSQKERGPRPAPVKRFSVDLPLYVIEQIRQKAHTGRVTKRRIVLQALGAGGLIVKDIDLEESSNV